MTREELLKSPEYWTQRIQIEIFRCADRYMEENNLNRTQLAQHLNVSKGYVTQILNGDCNFSLSKLVELAIKLNVVPEMEFTSIDEKIMTDAETFHSQTVRYNKDVFSVLKHKKDNSILAA